jgi:CheY-like chemotaxis protein
VISDAEDQPERPDHAQIMEAPAAAEPRPNPFPNQAEIPATSPAGRRSGQIAGGDETILVVEDEPMVREIVVRSLTHLGYTVHKANDGQEGLELSREFADDIDLIFSDIVMPRLSGPEMMQKVRQENRDTPVLFTTGFTESKHLLENGGDLREGIDLLQKPYTPNVLAERVREKLDSLSS